MSILVSQNKFDGGHAEDIRTFNTDECEFSKNFDNFTNPHKLIPYSDSIAETSSGTLMPDAQISDVDVSLIGTTYIITGVGYETSVSVKPSFYTKSDIVTAFSQQAVAAGNAFIKGSPIVYKDKMYALAQNGTQYTLYRYDSAGSVTNIGAINASTPGVAKPFVHPEDNILYIVIGTTITSWDGTTLTTTTTIMPSGMSPIGITAYGDYLAIVVTPSRGAGNATCYLWGRDPSINTFQVSFDIGEGLPIIVDNINNSLVFVMGVQNQITVINNKLEIRMYSGGAVQTVKSLVLAATQFISYYKAKNGSKLYFALSNDDAIYAFGKNKGGNYVITKDRYLFNGVTITGMAGLSMIGDILWRGFTIAGIFTSMRSRVQLLGETYQYNATSIYRTTINPLMSVAHRNKQKQLKAIRVFYTGATGGTIGAKVLVDGKNSLGVATTTFESAIAETSPDSTEQWKEAFLMADGVTPLGFGIEFQFQFESTGGISIKSYEYEYDLSY